MDTAPEISPLASAGRPGFHTVAGQESDGQRRGPVSSPSRLMRTFLPLTVLARSAAITSSAAAAGTSTSEKRSKISIAPDVAAGEPRLAGDGADQVLRAHARAAARPDEQPRGVAARLAPPPRGSAPRRPDRPAVGRRAARRGARPPGSPPRRRAARSRRAPASPPPARPRMTSNSSASDSTTTRKPSRSLARGSPRAAWRASAPAGARAGRRRSGPSRSRSAAR